MPRKLPKPDAAYLQDMLIYGRTAAEPVRDRAFSEYVRDQQLKFAVERAVEIVGETCRHVSEAFKAAHPEIPWEKIARQRHRLAHDYDDIDDSLIWGVVTIHVPALIARLEPLVPPPPYPNRPSPQAPQPPKS